MHIVALAAWFQNMRNLQLKDIEMHELEQMTQLKGKDDANIYCLSPDYYYYGTMNSFEECSSCVIVNSEFFFWGGGGGWWGENLTTSAAVSSSVI
jgi:hypothetical protein